MEYKDLQKKRHKRHARRKKERDLKNTLFKTGDKGVETYFQHKKAIALRCYGKDVKIGIFDGKGFWMDVFKNVVTFKNALVRK